MVSACSWCVLQHELSRPSARPSVHQCEVIASNWLCRATFRPIIKFIVYIYNIYIYIHIYINVNITALTCLVLKMTRMCR